MSWLQGSSTWATIDTDITKLLTGAMNDGVGANAGADAWQYDISSAYNTIRPPSSTDITLPAMSNRAGYWALQSCNVNTGNTWSSQPGATPLQTVCQMVAPFTNTTAASHGRVIVSLWVSTVNTVSANYSTARITAYVYDADSGAQLQGGLSLIPSAAGVMTVYNGLQVQITDPSGILPLNCAWIRGFTGTYLYGIDAWPWYPNRTVAPTFSTAPPGTAGTDYDLIDQVVSMGQQTPSNTLNTSYQPSVFVGNNQYSPIWGAYFSGMGCKTATSINGAKYTTTNVTVAQQKLAIVKSWYGGNGVLDLILGPAPADSVVPSGSGGGIRPSHCTAIGQWLKFAQTSASVTNAMVIQYWICVKPNGITICLNADPGFTGKMGTAGVWKMDNIVDPANDTFPWVATQIPADCVAGATSTTTAYFWTPYTYWSQRRRLDGSWGSRDWQTGWMRTDWGANGNYCSNGQYQWCGAYLGAVQVSLTGGATPQYIPTTSPVSKPMPDGYWDLYGLTLQEGFCPTTWGSGPSQYPVYMIPYPFNTGTNWYYYNTILQSTEQALSTVRGSLSTYALAMTGGGWGSGDELTDSVNGNKYLLVMPDYSGTFGRILITTNVYAGGTAIRENL